MTWIVGDVSGSETLTSADHLYETHINELRTASSGRIFITVGMSNADYVCDGTADDVQIQAAIDAVVTAGGGVVYIKEGTYYISASIIKDSSNITIKGAGIGKTILKPSTANITMLYFGSASGTTVRENIHVEGITFDENSVGLIWGIIASWCSKVTIKDCEFINPALTNRSMILVGKFSGASALWEARDITIENCIFDANSTGSWELVTLDYARDVKVINCTFKNKGSLYSLLNYGSEQVDIIGCHFYKAAAGIGIGGLGPTNVVGCTFEQSTLAISVGSNVNIIGNSFYGDSTFAHGTGISIAGTHYPAGSTEYPFYLTLPYTWNCKNIVVSGNYFKYSNAYAINGTNRTANSVALLDIYNIEVSNNIFDTSYYNGITVFGSYVDISDNTFLNSGQAGAGTVLNNIYVAAKYGILKGNTSFDDQTPATVTRDLIIDNALSATLITAQDWNISDNQFQVNGPPRFWTGAAFTDTKPSTITIKGQNNSKWNPKVVYAQGNVTGATTFNRANGSVITATLTGSITVTLSGTFVEGEELTLILTQGGTGSYTYTRTATTKLAGGSITLTATVGAVDILKFKWDGTNWNETSRSLNIS